MRMRMRMRREVGGEAQRRQGTTAKILSANPTVAIASTTALLMWEIKASLGRSRIIHANKANVMI